MYVEIYMRVMKMLRHLRKPSTDKRTHAKNIQFSFHKRYGTLINEYLIIITIIDVSHAKYLCLWARTCVEVPIHATIFWRKMCWEKKYDAILVMLSCRATREWKIQGADEHYRSTLQKAFVPFLNLNLEIFS